MVEKLSLSHKYLFNKVILFSKVVKMRISEVLMAKHQNKTDEIGPYSATATEIHDGGSKAEHEGISWTPQLALWLLIYELEALFSRISLVTTRPRSVWRDVMVFRPNIGWRRSPKTLCLVNEIEQGDIELSNDIDIQSITFSKSGTYLFFLCEKLILFIGTFYGKCVLLLWLNK